MASQETAARAQQLVDKLLGMTPTSEPALSPSAKQYGLGVESVKAFYGRNKTSVMVGAGVVVLAVVGAVGYGMWKKKQQE
jgi:hypothetical protein